MNKNVENIISAYATITNNHNKADIINKLSNSEIFNEIMNNNPSYLYEGYPSNLLEIVEELKQQAHCPSEIHKITEKSIVQYNKAKRTKSSSPQLLRTPIVVTASDISKHSLPLAAGLRIRTASAKKTFKDYDTPITVKAGNVLGASVGSVVAKKKPSKKRKAIKVKKGTT